MPRKTRKEKMRILKSTSIPGAQTKAIDPHWKYFIHDLRLSLVLIALILGLEIVIYIAAQLGYFDLLR